MPDPSESLGMYLHLARASERRRKTGMRDKMLVLAGVAAAERGLEPVASYCRQRILSNNPGHLVRRYPNLLSALGDERFQGYLKQLRRNYPPEKAEHMLDTLGISVAGEREAYFTDAEYAASILGISAETLVAAARGEQSARDDSHDRRIDSTAHATAPPAAATVHYYSSARLTLAIALALTAGAILGAAAMWLWMRGTG